MKPILFNTEMVRAILEGRKTVTRRVVKIPQGRTLVAPVGKDSAEFGAMCMSGAAGCVVKAPCQVNDVLYVRETWCKLGKLDEFEQPIDGTDEYYYRADGSNPTPYNYFIICGERRDNPKWYPSIHMPKEAARIFLRVTDVRVERLQDITEAQAIKEGCKAGSFEFKGAVWGQDDTDEWTAIDDFSNVWQSTIKKDQLNTYGWRANPYVWVIEFERITREQAEATTAAVP